MEGRDSVKKFEATICTLEKELARWYSTDLYQDICKYKFQLQYFIYNKKDEYALFRLRTRFLWRRWKSGQAPFQTIKTQNAANIIPAIKKGYAMVSLTKEIKEDFRSSINIYIHLQVVWMEKNWKKICNIELPKLDVLQSESLDLPINKSRSKLQ